jgi:NAD(P)-dependent dehydrogenase (short-subunit alcohol dehydrogenase family)
MSTVQLERWVLVTGANGGIGQAVSDATVAAGFGIIAVVRTPREHEKRSAPDRVQELVLDIARERDVRDSVARIDEMTDGRLFGIVHNAGIAIPGAFELSSLDEARRQIDTNVCGTLNLTHALLPRLRAQRGRLVVVTSVAGRLPMPFNAVHCGTKFFLEGMFSALRVELRAAGVHTILIEPGTIKTPMIDKFSASIDHALARVPPELDSLYGRPLRAMKAQMQSHIEQGSEPEVVARAVLQALTAPNPHASYAVGRMARPLTIAARLLPDRAKDRLMAGILGLQSSAHARAG